MEDREPYITGGKMREFLLKAMGECWHINTPLKELPVGEPYEVCPKCHYTEFDWADRLPPFNTWEGFGILWEWAINQEWWDDFTEATWKDLRDGEFQPDWVDNQLGIMPHLVSPNKFADAIYEYLKNRG